MIDGGAQTFIFPFQKHGSLSEESLDWILNELGFLIILPSALNSLCVKGHGPDPVKEIDGISLRRGLLANLYKPQGTSIVIGSRSSLTFELD